MDHIAEKDIRTHVTIIAWVLILTNALMVLLGIGLFGLLVAVGLLSAEAEAFGVLAVVGTGVGGFVAALGVPGIIAGWGLLVRKNWARILAIVVAGMSILNFPVGTLIGIYVIWVLLQRSAEGYFASRV